MGGAEKKNVDALMNESRSTGSLQTSSGRRRFDLGGLLDPDATFHQREKPLGSWWVNRMSPAFGCEDADPAVVHGDAFDEGKHAVARRAPERNPGSAGRRSLLAWRAAWIWQHVVDDIIWHVGGTTPLSGTYRGMDEVLDFMKREREAMVAVNAEMEMGDVLANDDHVVLLGTMSADLPDGRRTRSKYVQVFHVSDEKVHQVWEVEMSRMVEL